MADPAASLRQMLNLKSGDRLHADLVDGAIVLRPVNGKGAPTEPEQAIELPAVTSAAAPSLETTLPQKRPRGRPRKVPVIEHLFDLMPGIAGDPLPSPKRKPGRPRKVRLEEAGPAAEPGPSSTAGESALWKLRPKAELTRKALILFRRHPDAPSPPGSVAARSARSGGRSGTSRFASSVQGEGTTGCSGYEHHRAGRSDYIFGCAYSPGARLWFGRLGAQGLAA